MSDLAWQSRAVLLLVCPAAAVYAVVEATGPASTRTVATGAGISILFAAIVWSLRAATPAAACLGALLAFCYALTPSYGHSALWPLLGTLVLTLGASRVHRRARQTATVEARRGRSASQVAANLGVGALAGTLVNGEGMLLAAIVMTAALAELCADTLASELGTLAAAPPRLLLTGRVVAAGTDGAVSLPGTLLGVAGAIGVSLGCRWSFLLPWRGVAVAAGAGIFGLFFDSVLGQIPERRGWLNNDGVNFLSTLAAALVALACGRLLF